MELTAGAISPRLLTVTIREVTGYEFALRGRAKEAERAPRRPAWHASALCALRVPTPVIRSDNGLIFQSRRFRAACPALPAAQQEFITPYTSRSKMVSFRSLKEECVWLHNFGSFSEARAAIWYNTGRPHQALGYRSPRQFRALQPQLVA